MTDHEAVVAYIAAAFPVPSWEPETLRLYAAELADLPPDAVRLAAREWVQLATERPSVADLRRDAIRCAKRLTVEARRRELTSTARRLLLEPADPVDVRTLLADCVRRLGGGR